MGKAIFEEKCEHKTLHFEGRNLSFLVCNGCGRRWEREVTYSKNNRSTYFKVIEQLKTEGGK
jgi:hypothetical protein